MAQPSTSSNGGGVNTASADMGAGATGGGEGESSTAAAPASTSTSTPTSSSSSSLPTVPWAFIDCSTDTLIVLISHMLNLLIQHNDQVVLTPDALTRFHSRAAPGISVLEYLRRIVKYTNMEKIPLLSLLAYIDITCQHLPTFTLSSLTVHRFLIAGVCAGSKAQCDVFCTNAHYAKVGGIKVQELNALEREFLKVTQWNLCCNADLLQRYYTSLIRSHGGFTQLPEPSVIPFKAFPRSLSKPRSSDDADQEMGEPDQDSGEGAGGDAEGEEDVPAEEKGESPYGSSSKRRSVDVTDMIVDQQVEGSPSLSSGGGRGRRKSTGRRRSSTYETNGNGMEVDQDPDQSPSSPVSPATSSIPSSSRSSLRGGSRGRGRALSLSYTDPRPAEPQLDTSHASGSPFKSPQSRDGAAQSPMSQSSHSRLASTAAATAIDEDAKANRGAEHARDEGQEQNHHAHHDHHGAHLLKSLVGGIFHRRKSTHADKPPVPSNTHPAVPSTERRASGSASAGANGSSHVLPFQPVRTPGVKSPVPADLPPPPAPLPRPSSSAAAPIPPRSASPVMPPQGAPTPKSRGSSLTRSPRTLMSPGMAKPITPKIRTFEEMGEVPMT